MINLATLTESHPRNIRTMTVETPREPEYVFPYDDELKEMVKFSIEKAKQSAGLFGDALVCELLLFGKATTTAREEENIQWWIESCSDGNDYLVFADILLALDSSPIKQTIFDLLAENEKEIVRTIESHLDSENANNRSPFNDSFIYSLVNGVIMFPHNQTLTRLISPELKIYLQSIIESDSQANPPFRINSSGTASALRNLAILFPSEKMSIPIELEQKVIEEYKRIFSGTRNLDYNSLVNVRHLAYFQFVRNGKIVVDEEGSHLIMTRESGSQPTQQLLLPQRKQI